MNQHTAATFFHCVQTNVQQPFLNTACYCKLAAKQPIFETSQSCVSTTATLSHRFKSSPAIPGKVAFSDTAGYMMMAGHFCQNHVSSGDLNRPRESRGSQPSISLKHGRLAHVCSQFSLFRRSPTHKNLPPATFCTSERVFAVLFARCKKYQPVSLSGVSRFSKPRISSPQWRFRTNKIKTFPKGESRFCKPRFSLPQWRFRTNKIKSFPKGEIRGSANLK